MIRSPAGFDGMVRIKRYQDYYQDSYGISALFNGQFLPSQLFASGEQGAWYDPSDFRTMFQDSAGTIPVTAAGDPVGLILDKSGRGNNASQGTDISRPILQQDASGLWYLATDGSNDFFVTSNVNFTGTNKVTVFAGVCRDSDTTAGGIVSLGANIGGSNGSFVLFNPFTSSSTIASFYSRGTTTQSKGFTTGAAPRLNVLTGTADIGAPSIQLRANGASSGAATTTSQGTGNYGTYPLYVGRYGPTGAAFNGRIYSLIVRGAASSSAEIAAAEAWVNSKTGAY